MSLRLNERARRLADSALQDADRLGITRVDVDGGGSVIDCGLSAPGGFEAGVFLARLTLADLAAVAVTQTDFGERSAVAVEVHTAHPVAACLASQYAGWQVSVGKFFGMGSGPFRAHYGREALFDDIGHRERAGHAVGVLETGRAPDAEVFSHLAAKLELPPAEITLAIAPTASLAGCVQIVARSVETALHKLHFLGFDLSRIQAGFGRAILPPPHPDFLVALGRTNDAILYASQVHLWMRGDDASLEAIAPQIPSSASPEHGVPFAEIFERHERDFYRIDPRLFSPAVIALHNLDSGSTHSHGRIERDVIRESFDW